MRPQLRCGVDRAGLFRSSARRRCKRAAPINKVSRGLTPEGLGLLVHLFGVFRVGRRFLRSKHGPARLMPKKRKTVPYKRIPVAPSRRTRAWRCVEERKSCSMVDRRTRKIQVSEEVTGGARLYKGSFELPGAPERYPVYRVCSRTQSWGWSAAGWAAPRLRRSSFRKARECRAPRAGRPKRVSRPPRCLRDVPEAHYSSLRPRDFRLY